MGNQIRRRLGNKNEEATPVAINYTSSLAGRDNNGGGGGRQKANNNNKATINDGRTGESTITTTLLLLYILGYSAAAVLHAIRCNSPLILNFLQCLSVCCAFVGRR